MSTTSRDYTSLLQATLAVSRDANRKFLTGHRSPGPARRKGRIDLVTDTDLAIEAYLIERLLPLTPGAAVLAEESAESTAIPERCWIIDPVDGTTNFSHGWPLTGSCIAFYEDGEIRLGVISLPVLGECFYACAGVGAFQNGSRIEVSDVSGLDNALVTTGFPYDVEDTIDQLLPAFRAVQSRAQAVRVTGSSAVDMAWVACGRTDAYFETGVKPWDVAAGICILREAGGRVSEYDGSPFRFEKERIVASNGTMHQECVEVLRAFV